MACQAKIDFQCKTVTLNGISFKIVETLPMTYEEILAIEKIGKVDINRE